MPAPCAVCAILATGTHHWPTNRIETHGDITADGALWSMRAATPFPNQGKEKAGPPASYLYVADEPAAREQLSGAAARSFEPRPVARSRRSHFRPHRWGGIPCSEDGCRRTASAPVLPRVSPEGAGPAEGAPIGGQHVIRCRGTRTGCRPRQGEGRRGR